MRDLSGPRPTTGSRPRRACDIESAASEKKCEADVKKRESAGRDARATDHMTDAEVEAIIARVGEKKRPLDEVRDFSFARQAMKEIEAGR